MKKAKHRRGMLSFKNKEAPPAVTSISNGNRIVSGNASSHVIHLLLLLVLRGAVRRHMHGGWCRQAALLTGSRFTKRESRMAPQRKPHHTQASICSRRTDLYISNQAGRVE